MALAFPTAAKPLLSAPSSSQTQRSLVLSRRRSFRIVAAAVKWEPSKVVPQADRVLVRLEELPQKSAGGVLLPKSAVKFERYLMGEILSVGADVGEVEPGKKLLLLWSLEFLCSGGRRFIGCLMSFFYAVLFSDINAYEVDLGTESKHCFCKASELLAVVE